MATNEEKIKAFLNDEEKVKALANDEEFIEKISGGKATPEIYEQKFKELGLNLTDEEISQTAEMTNKLLSTSPEKLADISLEDVVGGHNCGAEGVMLGTVVFGVPALATGLAAVACGVGSKIASKRGDEKNAENCKVAAMCLGTLSGIALIPTLTFGIPTAKWYFRH